jgi:hypothetical protein
MRRGLMGWDAAELPKAAIEQRIARLRDAMAREHLDALLIYTNLVRPSAVTYVTGFTPYWSDGLLMLGRTGAPVFATALSARVAGWIRSTNPVSEIVNTPKPGAAIGQALLARGCRRIGVLELDDFPSGIFDDVEAAAPALELVEVGAIFAAVRHHADQSECALIARADALALAALAEAETDLGAGGSGEAGAAAGRVEKHARLGGAEEAYIAVAPDLDGDRRLIRISRPTALARRFALRASVAYKGSWVRRIRTFASETTDRDAIMLADAWLDRLAHGLASGQPLGAQIATSLAELEHAELTDWMAEATIGSYPLEVIADLRNPATPAPPDGGWLVITVALNIAGMPWIGARPALVATQHKSFRSDFQP